MTVAYGPERNAENHHALIHWRREVFRPFDYFLVYPCERVVERCISSFRMYFRIVISIIELSAIVIRAGVYELLKLIQQEFDHLIVLNRIGTGYKQALFLIPALRGI